MLDCCITWDEQSVVRDYNVTRITCFLFMYTSVLNTFSSVSSVGQSSVVDAICLRGSFVHAMLLFLWYTIWFDWYKDTMMWNSCTLYINIHIRVGFLLSDFILRRCCFFCAEFWLLPTAVPDLQSTSAASNHGSRVMEIATVGWGSETPEPPKSPVRYTMLYVIGRGLMPIVNKRNWIVYRRGNKAFIPQACS